jgi:hypothetical protein
MLQHLPKSQEDLTKGFHEATDLLSEWQKIESMLRKALHALAKETPIKTPAPAPFTPPERISSTTISYICEEVQCLIDFCSEATATLAENATNRKELPEHKTATDVIFIGHSLGGSLAQQGIVHFGPEIERIPLPGHRYVLRAYDSPAVSLREARLFMRFGKEHGNLLHALKQRWVVSHEMEYGDIIPLGGFRHLGATRVPREEYQDWLDIPIAVYHPLDTAEALEVASAPTHGRRFSRAVEGRDYSVTRLTSTAFHRFDNSLILDRQQNEVWGFSVLQSPLFTELFRKAVGVTVGTAARVHEAVRTYFSPPPGADIRDRDSVLFCSYQHQSAIKAC